MCKLFGEVYWVFFSVSEISTEVQAFDLSMDKITRIINSVSSQFSEISQLEKRIRKPFDFIFDATNIP